MKESIGFIAIGQGGGNIGSLFEENGYNVLFMNTSGEDLETLKTSKFKHHIKNGEGCNKDRYKAKGLIIEDFEAISNQINDKMQEEYIYVIFSAGGGTGSGASPMLIDLLIQNTQKKIGAITILPDRKEPIKTFINAYECFQELEGIENMCSTFILDNSKADKLSINKNFVNLFNAFIEMPMYKSIRGNIDKAEIKEMLNTRGATIINKIGKNTSSTSRLIQSFTDNIFAPIETDRVIKYIGISASTKIDMDSIVKEIGTCLDIFQSTNPTHTVCTLCGLSLPYTTLSEIKEKVGSHKDNITKNLQSTKENRLSEGINFLSGMPENEIATTQISAKDIFAKYRRK